MYIEARASLSAAEDAELDILLAASREADGVADVSRDKSLNRDKNLPSWFLARDGDKPCGEAKGQGALLGLLSVFAPTSEEAEYSIFVLPQARRRGIATALVSAAEAGLAPAAFMDELFVVNRRSAAGAAFAAARSCRLDFTEYGLSHGGPEALPASARGLPSGFSVVPATEDRLPALVDLMLEAFGGTREDEESMTRAAFEAPNRLSLLGLAAPEASSKTPLAAAPALVAAVSLGLAGKDASINGLAVAASERGKGYGKALVVASLERAWSMGRAVALDVDSTNATAYGLYLSLGFSVESAVDYWRRPFPG